MKQIIYLSFFVVLLFFVAKPASAQKVSISGPEGSDILIDGKSSGSSVEIKIQKKSCISVKCVKAGFISQSVEWCNDSKTTLPRTYFFKLEVDDSYESSSKSDYANTDIGLRAKTGRSEDETWKRVVIVTGNFFDIIEENDKNSGYLRTGWIVKSFKAATIRTRLVVKLSSTDPLMYKMKLISEVAGQAGVSAKNDEAFVEWDRILKKYETLVEEMNARVEK